MSFNDDFDQIIPSPNCKPGTGGNVVALCFHDEEYPELDTAAEDVARFFQNPSRQASTTGVIDNNSKVGCVPYGMTAWHSGHGDPWNYRIEGYEHSGYARQSPEEWLDPYGVDMLELSAAHFAKRCGELGIPIRKIDGAQLRQAVNSNDPSQGGIVGHKDISDATDGGHYDPGANFPWDYYIGRVQAHATGDPGPTPAPNPTTPVVTRGNSGSPSSASVLKGTVTEIQGWLKEIATATGDASMDPGDVDGIFGSKTEAAVMSFQSKAKDTDGNPLEVDGIVGSKTYGSMAVCVYLARTGGSQPPEQHSPAVPTFPGEVSIGQNGPQVTRVQQQLRDRGWAIDVDGSFGPQTQSVVTQFQADKGLAQDGIVGPVTWDALWTAPLT